MNNNYNVSLARIYYPVKVLGPGSRVGIWLNGCKRNCEGCISPELQFYDPSKDVSVQDITNMISRINDRIDGFTISGGEPFYNPIALSALVAALASINDDILIFTGYTMEELHKQNDEATRMVLNTCAAIIDGPFIKDLNERKGLRGSSNQRCWVFKYHDRYSKIMEAERSLQNVLYGEGIVTFGIP